jgi:hypothetical protein
MLYIMYIAVNMTLICLQSESIYLFGVRKLYLTSKIPNQLEHRPIRREIARSHACDPLAVARFHACSSA